MHPYLAFLFHRDYFRQPDSSLSCSFVPQGLFPPTEFIPILHFFATGIISTGQIHPYLAFLFHKDYFRQPDSSLSCSFVPQGLFRPTGCIPSLEDHHWKAIAENISARPFRQISFCTADSSFKFHAHHGVSSISQTNGTMLQFQQFDFSIKPAGVPRQAAICAHDPMAWNDDRDGITPDRSPDGLCRHPGYPLLQSYVPCDLAVAYRFPIWNLQKYIPDRFLKCRSLRM